MLFILISCSLMPAAVSHGVTSKPLCTLWTNSDNLEASCYTNF